ncbi:hypothetical protein [Roseateles saccharophilus]|uniref:Molybdopterin-dependent oxidoreductase-like protein n=1 Tax=Roseateles saccharophilus TaxID=304 RepID=A0A4R3VHX2_ROSSA|nr:hypothetical protein [Roseateles saccharophilus]MDG0832044.1 hypothetical protein [Roseateles saccharophilus]TCV03452.1 hypothetical protein EV671_1003107 [Roseateles saccharophilus]
MQATSLTSFVARPGAPRCPGRGLEAPQLIVGGWVRQPLRLDVPALQARGAEEVDFQVVCTFDGAHGDSLRLRAVPLAPLIDEAQPAFEHRTDFKRVAIVAESSEGYRALFSWNELFNTPVGAGVMIAFASPCAPSHEHRGAFTLISRQDLHTGPRYVRHLALVEVVKLW